MWLEGRMLLREKMCPLGWTMAGQKVGLGLKMGMGRTQFPKKEMGPGKICGLRGKCVLGNGL
jgi:hypothetical protein